MSYGQQQSGQGDPAPSDPYGQQSPPAQLGLPSPNPYGQQPYGQQPQPYANAGPSYPAAPMQDPSDDPLQQAAEHVMTVEEAMEENFENERDKVIHELMDELSYRQQLYILASTYAAGQNLWFVIPILVLGTMSAFGAFLGGTPLIEDIYKPEVRRITINWHSNTRIEVPRAGCHACSKDAMHALGLGVP